MNCYRTALAHLQQAMDALVEAGDTATAAEVAKPIGSLNTIIMMKDDAIISGMINRRQHPSSSLYRRSVEPQAYRKTLHLL